MQLIILGKNADDKGTQLERLTGSILKRLGYTKLVFNEQGSGGNELDVKATYFQPSIASKISRKAIIECKAYNKHINLPDWLKFLGKIFTEELGRNPVQGCLIALSGANGNVMGHYNIVKAVRDDITLLSGEDLVEELKEPYNLQDVEEVLQTISAQTQRQVVNLSLCYYEKLVYWIVSFQEGQYTLLSHDAGHVSLNEVTILKDMLIKEIDVLTYVDLESENEAYIRAVDCSQGVLAILMSKSIPQTFSSIYKAASKVFEGKIIGLNMQDIRLAIANLVKNNVFKKVGSKYDLVARSIEGKIEDRLQVYRLSLLKNIFNIALKSEFYQKNIDKELLLSIFKLQGGLKIPEERFDELIQVLRWSPSALIYAITPDPFMMQHRGENGAFTSSLEEHDVIHFERRLYQLFEHDFKTQGFAEYMMNYCKISELETNVNIKIKSKEAILVEKESKERLGLYNLIVEDRNIPAIISILDGAPEPWENEVIIQDTIPPKKKNIKN